MRTWTSLRYDVPESRACEVGGVAHVALVVPHSAVCSHVEVKTVLSLQTFAAHGADKVLVLAVLHRVLLQRVPVRASLAAV